jgi:hypothetical protein
MAGVAGLDGLLRGGLDGDPRMELAAWGHA